MTREEQVEAAKNTALNSLSASAKTRGQLEQKLAEKGHVEDVVKEALDRLAEVGLVDDGAFARSWVTSRHSFKGLSASAIRRELRMKKVDDELIDAALEDLTSEDEVERARELVERKAKSTRGLPRDARVRRLVGMLARKGYGGVAFSIVKEVLDNESDAEISDDYLDSGED
jgi:regulatory protein